MKRIILTLLTLLSVGAFANGTSEDYIRTIKTVHSKISYETVGELEMAPTAGIIDIFVNHSDYDDHDDLPPMNFVEDHDDYDVDAKNFGMGIDPKSIETDVLENINAILLEDTEDVKDMINSVLKSGLVKGEIEYTYMIIGNNLFSASIDF